MPVAKQNTGNGFSGVIGYVLVQKDVPEHLQPKILECNNVLQSSGQDMAKQMRSVAQDNDRVKKPVAHLQISFHPDEKVSSDQAQQVIDSLLSDIGVKKEDHQYLVVEHFDKPHQHYHVVLNRVDFEGKVLNDSNINLRLNVACDKVEKKQGLRPTPGRTRVYDPTEEKGYKLVDVGKSKKINKVKSPKVNTAKADLQGAVKNALSNKSVQSIEQLKVELSKKGFTAELTKDGKGISFGKPKTHQSAAYALKGSAIGYKWSDINRALEANKQHRQAPQPTEKEVKELRVTTQYNEGFKSIIDDFKVEVSTGNLHFDLDQMIRHNLRNVQDHPILQGYLNEDVPKLKKAYQDLINDFNDYQQREREFEILMRAERERTSLLTALQGKNVEIERRNEELEKRKVNAIKPEFKPLVTLSERDFEKTTTFSQMLDRWDVMQHNKDLAAKIQKRISQNESRDPEEPKRSRGKGL